MYLLGYKLLHSRVILAGFSVEYKFAKRSSQTNIKKSIFDMDHPVDSSGRRPMMRAKQKPIVLIIHLLRNFCSWGETILSFCMGTTSTVKAKVLAPKHFKFFQCNGTALCPSKPMPTNSKALVHHVLDVDCNITKTNEIREVARRCRQRRNAQ